MFCTNCGAQVEDGTLFCTNCGAKLEAAQNAAPEVKTEAVSEAAQVTQDTPVESYEQAPAASSYEQAPAASSYEQAPSAASYEQAPAAASYEQAPSAVSYEQDIPTGVPADETPKKKIGLLIGIIAGVVALVAAIVLLCVFVFFKKDDDSSSKKNKADTEESSDDEDDDEKSSKKKKKKKDVDDEDDDDDDDEKETKKKKKKKDDEDIDGPGAIDEPLTPVYVEGTYESFDTLAPVTDEQRAVLSGVQSDYGTINWTTEYSIAGSGLVLSIAEFQYIDDYENGYAFCITNTLPDTTLDIYGTVSALSESKNSVGDGYFNNSAISPGSQEIGIIICDGEPSGAFEIDLSACKAEKEEGTWTSDYSASKDSYSLELTYELHNNLDVSYEAGDIYCFALDSSGNVLGYGYGYPLIVLDPGKSSTGEVYIYVDGEQVANTTGIAMFVETLVVNDEDKFLESDGTGYYSSDDGTQLYMVDNGDNTCGLYLKVANGKNSVEYVDPNAGMRSGYVDFSNPDTGESIGSISFYSDTAYLYIYDSGVDDEIIEDGSTFELTRGTASSKDIKGFVSAIDKKK